MSAVVIAFAILICLGFSSVWLFAVFLLMGTFVRFADRHISAWWLFPLWMAVMGPLGGIAVLGAMGGCYLIFVGIVGC